VRPTITIDTSRWKAAAIALKETSSRTCVDFINGQALKVAVEAVRRTDKANRAQIAHILGQTGQGVSFKQVTRGKNKGQMRTRRGGLEVKENSFAERILGARFRDTGSWGVKGETMAERVSNLIKSRVRSASFIAAGWIGARNVLWSQVRQKPAGTQSMQGARQVGRPKGTATPAKFTMNSILSATIVNSAFNTNPKAPSIKGDAGPVATKGLQDALNAAADDMIAELERRLNPDFKRVSAK